MFKKSGLIRLLVGILFIVGATINDGYSFFSLPNLFTLVLYTIAFIIIDEPLNQYYK